MCSAPNFIKCFGIVLLVQQSRCSSKISRNRSVDGLFGSLFCFGSSGRLEITGFGWIHLTHVNVPSTPRTELDDIRLAMGGTSRYVSSIVEYTLTHPRRNSKFSASNLRLDWCFSLYLRAKTYSMRRWRRGALTAAMSATDTVLESKYSCLHKKVNSGASLKWR